MKTLRSIMLAAFIIPLIFAFTSCQKDNSTSPVSTDNTVSTDFVMLTITTTQSTVQDADENDDAVMIPPVDGIFIQCDNNKRESMMDGRDKPKIDMNFARIFRVLRLTKDQMTQIRPFMQDYNLCVRDAMKKLRESEKAIIDAANAQRRLIMQEVKDSLITRDSARTLLRQLNLDTRSALKNNPARVTACEEIQACRQSLFDKIRAILTDAQKALWDAWIAMLPVVDCTKQN